MNDGLEQEQVMSCRISRVNFVLFFVDAFLRIVHYGPAERNSHDGIARFHHENGVVLLVSV